MVLGVGRNTHKELTINSRKVALFIRFYKNSPKQCLQDINSSVYKFIQDPLMALLIIG